MQPLFAEQGIPLSRDFDASSLDVDPESARVRRDVLITARDPEKLCACRIRGSLQWPFAHQLALLLMVGRLVFENFQ